MGLRAWAAAYLALLREEPRLHTPFLDLEELARRLDVPVKTLRSRRAYRTDVREAEAQIIAEHAGRLRAAAEQLEPLGEETLHEDLPPVLERYLDVYADLDRSGSGGRLDAVARLQQEGFEISWLDVVRARRLYPAFDRALSELWDEGNVAVDDTLRQAARQGKNQARAMYLRGNIPEKYGNRLRVNVAHYDGERLDARDRQIVEDLKARHFPRAGRQRSPVSPDEDVIEGEFSEAP